MKRARSRLGLLLVLGMLTALLPIGSLPAASAGPLDLVITGVIDGPLTGGIPKAVELYAVNAIPDLSAYGVGSANNGGGTDGEEFTFPADSAAAGDFIYLATEATGFTDFFGFAPDYTDGSATNINGDDAIELFNNGVVIDVFGDINTDGTGQPWEHLDGWAYRVDSTGPDGSTFVLGNWTFSGINALDGESTNATATTPFPIGTYVGPTVVTPTVNISEFHYDNVGTDAGEFVEITGDAGADLTGWSIVLYNGSNGTSYNTLDLSAVVIDDEGSGIGAVDIQLPANGLQNGSPDGMALVDGTGAVVEFLSYEGTFAATDGPANGQTSVDVDVAESSSTAIGQSLQLIGGTWVGPAEASPGVVNGGSIPTAVNISEIHYDNAGGDVGEFIEVTGDAGADLTGWTIALYNGNGGGVYDTINLTGTIDDENGTQGAVSFPFAGIQNGSPDGMALVDPLGTAIEFLSYEGTITAVGGPADGTTSTDLGVTESSSTPIGQSLQLIDGTWIGPVPESPGVLNTAPPLVPTKIYDIQGSGLASPLVGSSVAIEGVVTSDQQDGDFNGFFMQEVTGDADTTTSDGIFVFEGSNTVDVNVGDVVRVEGIVDEFFDMTEITSVSAVSVIGTAPVVATPVSLPWATLDQPEQYEGMYITVPQPLYISEYFNFDRFGEIVLTTDRAPQPTAVFDPGSPEATALAEANQLARITLDDNRTSQNPFPAIHPNGAVFDVDNSFRGGDIVENVTGVVNYSFGLYRIQPTQGADYTAANPRTATPDDVGGSLKVASFNVLNYFTTIDTGAAICGPNQDLGCRGADNADELARQRTKIVAAIGAIDADVVGLIEIENNPATTVDEPLADLVSGLNDLVGAGTYDYVHTGPIGDDAIKVAFIYKPATVSLNGSFAVLDSTVDPRFNDDKNRPALAQTFTQLSNGESVTVAVNHLKSKGSSCDSIGDPDTGDGAGNCNLTRTAAAAALVDWLAADATGSGDDDVLIIGDLNSYDKEDPIDALLAGGYTDLVFDFLGEFAYSFVFSGQWGYLDYALANPALQSAVTGTTIWHINADEPDILDYDTNFNDPSYYEPNLYRASDHDPVVIGLELDRTAPVVTAEFVTRYAGFFTGLFEVDYSCVDAGDPNPSCVGDINGISVDDGQRVFLIKTSHGTPWHRQIGSILYIKDSSFTLTVTGTDAVGNTATVTAEPAFRVWHWRGNVR